MQTTEYLAFYRVETVGSPIFPRFPVLFLIWSPTPSRLSQLAIVAASVLSQQCEKLRLASGGQLALTVQDWLPVGKL